MLNRRNASLVVLGVVTFCLTLWLVAAPESATAEPSAAQNDGWQRPTPKNGSFEGTLIFENSTKRTVMVKAFRPLEGDWVGIITTKDKAIYLKCKEVVFEEKD